MYVYLVRSGRKQPPYTFSVPCPFLLPRSKRVFLFFYTAQSFCEILLRERAFMNPRQVWLCCFLSIPSLIMGGQEHFKGENTRAHTRNDLEDTNIKVTALTFFPKQHNLFAFATSDKSISLGILSNNKISFEKKLSSTKIIIDTIIISPDERYVVATGPWNQNIFAWDLLEKDDVELDRIKAKTIPCVSVVKAIAFLDGKNIVASQDVNLITCNIESKTITMPTETETDDPTEDEIAHVSLSPNKEHTLALYDNNKLIHFGRIPQKVRWFNPPDADVISFFSDNTTFISSSSTKKKFCYLWGLDKKTCTKKIAFPFMTSVIAAPVGNYIIAETPDKHSIIVYDLENNKAILEHKTKNIITCKTVSHDGKCIGVGCKNSDLLFIQAPECLHVPDGKK